MLNISWINKIRAATEHKNFYDLLFIVLIAAVLILNFSHLSYPFPNNMDPHRDYLVSHHIVEFQEYPLTGPHSTFFPQFRSSPIYTYLLAGFLLINDSLLSLSIINILLQAAGLVFFYLFSKKLFNPASAFYASLLYGLSLTFFRLSYQLWQPPTMAPFLMLSFLLLTLSFTKKKYWLVLLANFVFIFACSLHRSALVLLPAFAIASVYIVRRIKLSHILFYFGPAAVMIASLFLAHIPVLMRNAGAPGHNTFDVPALSAISISKYLINFQAVVSGFFSTLPNIQDEIRLIAILVLVIAALFYVKNSDNKECSKLLILFAVIIQPLILLPFIKGRISDYHFFPVYALSYLFVSHLIASQTSNKKLLPLKLMIFFLLTLAVSSNFYTIKAKSTLPSDRHLELSIEKQLKLAIGDIQKKENHTDLHFFDIWLQYRGTYYEGTDAYFWNILERTYNTKFVRLTDEGLGYKTVNKDDYLFIICYNYAVSEQNQCLETIGKQNPRHALIKKISEPGNFDIYLAKKLPNQ